MFPRLLAAAAAMRGQTPEPVLPVEPPEVVADGWQNAASGLGIMGIDKAVGITFGQSNQVYRPTLSELYRFDGIAAKIIDRPVWDSVRQGWTIDVQADSDDDVDTSAQIDKELAADMAPLNLRPVYSSARKWARLYGNALIIAGLDDVTDGDLEQPVQAYGQVNWLKVVAAGYGGPVTAERNDPDDTSRVTMYVINPHGKASKTQRIHPDRVWVVQGVELPAEIATLNDCWDDSIIQRIFEALSRVATADGTGVTFLSERSLPIWKIKGLMSRIGKAGDALVQRFQDLTVGRSIYKAIILDQGTEEFETMDSSASGIAELLEIYPSRVAAVSNIPVTILYGTSPGGLNATGASDFQGYYDFVAGSEQAEHLDPFLRWVTELVMLGNQGPTRGNVVPYTVRFSPLTQPTAEQEASTRQTNANTDVLYIQNGVYSEEEVRQSRFGGTEYGTEITLDESPDVEQVAAQFALAAGLPSPGAPSAPSGVAEIPTGPTGAPVVGVPESATILNGAQITSLLSVTAEVTNGNVSPIVALEALKLLGIDPITAQAMVDAAAGFKPRTPEATP